MNTTLRFHSLGQIPPILKIWPNVKQHIEPSLLSDIYTKANSALSYVYTG